MKIKRTLALKDAISFISLTDIMMTVLLFFILTSGASQDKSESFINIKHSALDNDKKDKTLVIKIDKTGNFVIDKKKIIKTQLKNTIQKSSCSNIIMEVDKLVPIIFVVEVMNIADELGISTSLKAAKQ